MWERKRTKPSGRSAGTKQAKIDAKKAKAALRKRKIKTAIAQLEMKRAILVLKARKCDDAIARLNSKPK